MIPNLITGLRILVLPFLAWSILEGSGWIAVALFLGAGLTDILDGQVARRTGKTSAFGAMFDLLADRLLTLVSLAALIAIGAFPGLWIAAPLVLIARNFFMAGVHQTLPPRDYNLVLLEYPKIALNFLGVALLLAPLGTTRLGLWATAASAALCGLTCMIYAWRAVPAWRALGRA